MAESTNEGSVRIAKLNQDNYAVWCKQIMFLLTSKDLDEAVLQDADWLSEGTVAEKKAKARVDRKALALIGLAVEPYFLSVLDGCETAKEAWLALENVYRTKSTARLLQLSRELVGLQKGAGESLAMYVSRAKSIRDQLIMGGQAIEEKEVAWRVLIGLPEEYGMVATLLENSEKELELEEVMARLLPVEQRNLAKEQKVEALYTRRSQNKGKKEIECWECGKTGHIKRDCPLLKNTSKGAVGASSMMAF